MELGTFINHNNSYKCLSSFVYVLKIINIKTLRNFEVTYDGFQVM